MVFKVLFTKFLSRVAVTLYSSSLINVGVFFSGSLRHNFVLFHQSLRRSETGGLVLAGCVMLLHHRPDLLEILRILNHYPAYQAIVVSANFGKWFFGEQKMLLNIRSQENPQSSEGGRRMATKVQHWVVPTIGRPQKLLMILIFESSKRHSMKSVWNYRLVGRKITTRKAQRQMGGLSGNASSVSGIGGRGGLGEKSGDDNFERPKTNIRLQRHRRSE